MHTKAHLRILCKFHHIERLVVFLALRANANQHTHNATTFEVALEQMRQLRIAIGHEGATFAARTHLLIGPQRFNAHAQRHQRVIDVSGLPKPVSSRVASALCSLRAGEIDEGQLRYNEAIAAAVNSNFPVERVCRNAD